MRLTRSVALLTASMLLAACTGDSSAPASPSPTATSTATTPPRTAAPGTSTPVASLTPTGTPAPTSTPAPPPPPVVTPPPATATSPAGTPTPAPPVPTPAGTPPPPTATPTLEPGRTRVLAPIEQVDVRIAESAPPQVFVDLTSGLPGGCARFDHYTVARAGSTVTITAWNTMPTAVTACTAIYGYVRNSVALGSGFAPGTYTLRVNDVTRTFAVP